MDTHQTEKTQHLKTTRSILHLDFETRSDIDLVKCGLHIYARGKNTDIICMAYAFDDAPVQIWFPNQGQISQEIKDHILSGREIWAHNAAFEIQIANNVGLKYGFPQISPEQTVCTMAMAHAMALPGALERAAAALGISERKDMEGSRLMIQMSKPRWTNLDGTIEWWDSPEKIERLANYCMQDIVVEREIGKRMFKLSPYEKRVWLLDQEINNLGICVDRSAIENAVNIAETEKDRLNNRIREVTNNAVATCNAVQQIKDFLEFRGVNADSIDKASTKQLLEGPIDAKAREVLNLRTMAAKASTAKFTPMLSGSNDSDRRVRGCFQYSGANTRRWVGRRIQLQNLKRPTIKHDAIEEIVGRISRGMTGAEIDLFYGPPLDILSECVRSFLVADKGKCLVACDFSAIEARVIAWLAGEELVLETFRSKKDIYKVAASQIFGVKYEEVNDGQRQVGKVAILALGYGGGVGAFQTMASGYGVRMEPVFTYLWSSADAEQQRRVEDSWKQNGTKYEITREEFIASDLTKMFWRENNKNIVQYWYDLENAAMNAVLNSGKIYKAGHLKREVHYKKNGSFLWCLLPSGGTMCYPYPEIKETKTPWNAIKNSLSYMSEDGLTRKWTRFTTYGGSLSENITQAVARDLLADSMLRIREKNRAIVGHVHDEIILETDINNGKQSLELMRNIMATPPKWGKDLPLLANGWYGPRYRK